MWAENFVGSCACSYSQRCTRLYFSKLAFCTKINTVKWATKPGSKMFKNRKCCEGKNFSATSIMSRIFFFNRRWKTKSIMTHRSQSGKRRHHRKLSKGLNFPIQRALTSWYFNKDSFQRQILTSNSHDIFRSGGDDKLNVRDILEVHVNARLFWQMLHRWFDIS